MTKYDYWYNYWKELKDNNKTTLTYGQFLNTLTN